MQCNLGEGAEGIGDEIMSFRDSYGNSMGSLHEGVPLLGGSPKMPLIMSGKFHHFSEQFMLMHFIFQSESFEA